MGNYNLSACKYSHEGRVVNFLLGHHMSQLLKNPQELSGCQYDGGQHTLYLFLSKDDAHAYLDLAAEEILRIINTRELDEQIMLNELRDNLLEALRILQEKIQ